MKYNHHAGKILAVTDPPGGRPFQGCDIHQTGISHENELKKRFCRKFVRDSIGK
jgi:hypothetical protein